MSAAATQTKVQAEDFSTELQGRTRVFTAFYEQHAYLAYNLALRIACEADAAKRAVQSAFLTQLDERPAGLLPSTVAAALQEAPSRPSPSGAGDPQAEALLAVTARLAPTERAALAMVDLAHAGPESLGEALGLDAEQATKLLHRGRETFGAQLGVSRAEADQMARQWMWAAPPDVIWEELYPQFHRAVERQLRRGEHEQTLILSAAGNQGAAPPKGVRRRRPWRWSRRPRWAVVVPILVMLALGAGAVATQLTGGGAQPSSRADTTTSSDIPGLPSDSPDASSTTPADAGDAARPKEHKPLTAAELDKLRLRELAMLRKYTKRQADTRLSAAERSAAARQIAMLQREARSRLSAQSRRERLARDRAARQRAKVHAPPPPPPYTSAPRPTPRRTPAKTPNNEAKSPQDKPPSTDEADKTCLLDEDSGQYICPQ